MYIVHELQPTLYTLLCVIVWHAAVEAIVANTWRKQLARDALNFVSIQYVHFSFSKFREKFTLCSSIHCVALGMA